ncbi:uncharacterized protein [Cherax quadricarinatus]|uniref:uncharacterized protein isoform X3 n=1 Tax=Cherax quadricarinatus TaxID=27406 RepID=UPI00387EC151
MDREWTYRPPVLVGERVVWLGGSPGLGTEEPCEYGPHHGTVSWIGKVPEMGNHWTVGVEFEFVMAGGCDGSWNGRHLFTCPNARGLFLPLLSLIKEKEFYGNKHTTSETSGQTRRTCSFTCSSTSVSTSLSSDKAPASLDLSLAPEPPPPKNRASSSDSHGRTCMKQSGAEMIHAGSSSVSGSKSSRQNHINHHDQSVNSISVMASISSPPSAAATSTCTAFTHTVYSSTSKSKKEVLAGRLVQGGTQDTSLEKQTVSASEDDKRIASGTRSPSRGGSDEDWHDALAYFGETMVRKSTLLSEGRLSDTSGRLGQIRQPSMSTPSSPTLNDYQRHHGKKLSCSSTSTTASDVSKYMSSPGRYSMGDRAHPNKKEKTSGFLNIFRWFRNREKKKRATSVDRMSNTSTGSVNSLSSSASGLNYAPIMRSKSADTHKKMSSKTQPQFGITRRYKLFSRNVSHEHKHSEGSSEEGGRRLSVVSTSSDTLSRSECRGTTLSRKKRLAPQPPGSPKASDSGSLRSQKSCTSLPARESRPIMDSGQGLQSPSSWVPEGRKLQKCKSEGVIYAKVKRRAPLPPGQIATGTSVINDNKEKSSTLTKEGQKRRQAPCVPSEKSDRPLSSVSTGSCLSQSPSSASTTLKSQSSSVASSGAPSSQYSSESVRLESGFLRQDITKSSSSPAIPDSGKLTLSPRPWYKRKKNKDKEINNDSKLANKKDKVYDSWMPDIQFSRSKLSLTGTFRKSKSFESSDDGTFKKSKEDDRKEKRKSQVSLLANISELDRAASEQMQRELEQRKAQRKTYDSKFYKTCEPHILTQTDFLPRTRSESEGELFDGGTLSSSGTATLGSLASNRTEAGEHAFPNHLNGIYDNLNDTGPDLTLPQSYSKQATLRMDEKEGNFHHSSECKPSAPDASLIGVSGSSPGPNSPKTSRSTSHLSHSAHILGATTTQEPLSSIARESPIRRATFDAELFYRLAKDTQVSVEPKSKNSPNLTGVKEKMASYEEVSEEEIEDEASLGSESLGQFRRLNKNFGLRMNNFFSPDVSTIIEASESMTSSATTPADDIYEDLPVPSSVMGRAGRESVHDELNSEVNYDIRLNTADALEIMQDLADVRQEIQMINIEEENEARNREKKRADKICEEMFLSRNRSNFEIWQNAIGHVGPSNTDAAPPPPIDLNEGTDRKLKWVCEVCTLINLPWRLQCEACMVRRPSNPKRIDEDGKSFTSDHIGSQPSISDESPVTVIHDEGNVEGSREALGGPDALVPDTCQIPEGDQKSRDKKKKDINWERELQKYFKTFDEHVKGSMSDTKDCALNSETLKPNEMSASEAEECYGKIRRSSRNESGTTGPSTSEEPKVWGKGAKPKTGIFGTAAGPPDMFIQTSDHLQTDNELKTLEFTIKEMHKIEDLDKEPDMEQLRRVRIAKFQGNTHTDGDQMNHSEACSLMVVQEKKTTKKHGDKRKKSKTNKTELQEDKENELENSSDDVKSLSKEQVLRLREIEYQHKEEKSFYSKNFRKPQVLKPSGAVRNVVSIFNQFEQLQHAKKEKPRVTRRRSFGNVVGRTQIFEQLNNQSNNLELQRSQAETREVNRPQFKSDVPRDTEVFSAIAKFDEMAAMAELEKIEKQRLRKEAAKRKPKFSTLSYANENVATTTTVVVSYDTSSINSTYVTADSQSYTQLVLNTEPISGKPPLDPKSNSHSIDLSEGIIKGGVLYTEQRKRSMSIGSGTFELIQAKDFETIEAQHSECSPTGEGRSITNPVTLSQNTENWSIAPSPNPPGVMVSPVVPDIVIEPHVSLPSCSANTTVMVSEAGDQLGGHEHTEKKEVERLSRQLTEADGIATFKATLRVEESTLGQLNTLNINRLLKRLEGAIAHGNHADAAQLAHELAELRVSCSVTRNPRSTVNNEASTSASAATLMESEAEQHFTDSNISPVHTLNNTQTGSASEECHTCSENTEGLKNTTSSPPATRRDTRVDPARREVKSDTISKLPDGPPVYMKNLSESVLPFNVKMYVEDKNSHQGPITFAVTSSMTVGELRKKVCQDFGFPPEVQRWILGRRLADDDNHTLEHHKVTTEACPIFLYLVAPDSESKVQVQTPSEKTVISRHNGCHYGEVRRVKEDEPPRHLQDCSKETNEQYKFYNPDTNKYEISIDEDDSDVSGEEDTSEEDTLEEEDDDENVYQNETFSEKEKEKDQHVYNSAASRETNLQQNENKIYKSVLLQSQGEKYLLPQPLNSPHITITTNAVSSQDSNSLAIYSNAVSTSHTSSTSIAIHATHSQSDMQEHNKESYRLLQYQSTERQMSQPAEKLSQQHQIQHTSTYKQMKLHNETIPIDQQQVQIQETKCSTQLQHQKQYHQHMTLQHQSSSNQLISLNPQESIPTQSSHTEYTQDLPSNHNGLQKLDFSKPTQEFHIRECELQPQIPKYSTGHPTPLSVHTQETPTQEHPQLPWSKKSQEQSSEFQLQSSHSQHCLTQPTQNHSNQFLEHQSTQSSQQQDSQSSQQDTFHPQQQLGQPQHQKQSLQLQLQREPQQNSRKPEQQLPEQQRHFMNNDAAATKPQLSGQQVDMRREPPASPTKTLGWVCPRCTLVNKWTRPGCEACATERPGDVNQHETGFSHKTPGLGAVMFALERQGCVPNPDPFECRVCFVDINSGEGVVLRDCLHTFCRDCLASAIKYSETADVKCPYRDNQYSCDSSLQDREIKALVTPEEYEKHLTKSVKQAEGNMQNVFHCKTPDCPGFCQFEDNVNIFHCDVCKKVNCLTCQAQHEGITCQAYQDDLAQKVDEAAMKTKKFFDDMIRRGDGLPCPKCSVMLMRKWGCDWMRCPMCRTEICWVTGGPRWGPGGPGDVSGGCKCGIRGRKCHPKCTYCH